MKMLRLTVVFLILLPRLNEWTRPHVAGSWSRGNPSMPGPADVEGVEKEGGTRGDSPPLILIRLHDPHPGCPPIYWGI